MSNFHHDMIQEIIDKEAKGIDTPLFDMFDMEFQAHISDINKDKKYLIPRSDNPYADLIDNPELITDMMETTLSLVLKELRKSIESGTHHFDESLLVSVRMDAKWKPSLLKYLIHHIRSHPISKWLNVTITTMPERYGVLVDEDKHAIQSVDDERRTYRMDVRIDNLTLASYVRLHLEIILFAIKIHPMQTSQTLGYLLHIKRSTQLWSEYDMISVIFKETEDFMKQYLPSIRYNMTVERDLDPLLRSFGNAANEITFKVNMTLDNESIL